MNDDGLARAMKPYSAAIKAALDACDDAEVTESAFGCEVGATTLAKVIRARIESELEDSQE